MPALRLAMYGEGGVGKTTLALSFPKPLVIDTDGGLEGDAVIDVTGDEWTPDKWQDLNALYSFIKQKVDDEQYGTVVIDSLDTLCNFLRFEAMAYAATGRPANASESQLIMAMQQDYGRVETAMSIFLQKLKMISKERGIHIVLTSAVRLPDAEKGRPKRTFDVQPAVESLVTHWANIYGEMVAVELPKEKGSGEVEEHRILWTKVSDTARRNKTRFAALRPGVTDPTYSKLVGLIKGEAK